MENPLHGLKFCHVQKRRWLFLISLVAVTHMLCQSVLLPYSNALLSLLPGEELEFHTIHGSFVVTETNENINYVSGKIERGPKYIDDLKVEKKSQVENFVDLDEKSVLDNGQGDSIPHLEKAVSSRHGLSLYQILGERNEDVTKNVTQADTSLVREENKSDNDTVIDPDEDFVEFSELRNDTEIDFVQEKPMETEKPLSNHNVERSDRNSSENTTSTPEEDEILKMVVPEIGSTLDNGSSSSVETRSIPIGDTPLIMSNNGSSLMNTTVKKKKRCDMPPKTVMPIHEMNQLLERRRRSSRAMRPRWSSARDQEIIAAKFQIENAPAAKNNEKLYGPLFRNVSKFKRSYELMERTLKVYVYKEGEKPIFHQPMLKGLYASEGWFMKLLLGNKQFVVKDPQRAHLFYMPFSSRMLEYTLYVRNSHNHTNLKQYLKRYSEKIATKYRFWNRTGGADHFLVACHDWAPYETRHHMEHCIKALCNADVTAGFKIGRDVSLPETYVHSARNPLRDLGGYPLSKRHIFTFFAGNMHGYLRPILLKQWKEKDPDMKIFGPMTQGVASKMNYIQHMKSSKYCICPKGYNVNSPRVVEAIFYECVPVIISDNFVPPFFDILNWDAFSVIVAEKDIPNLKEILTSIPEKKYLDMQLAVRKVQRHFLWHAKPSKYDLFHMTLHSIWYNRVYQIKPR